MGRSLACCTALSFASAITAAQADTAWFNSESEAFQTYNMGSYATSAFEPIGECSDGYTGACYTASDSNYATETYTQKIASWSDSSQYLSTNLALDGFSASAYFEPTDGIRLREDSIQFILGAGASSVRKVISNWAALSLTSPAKAALVKSPASFVSVYGPYFVSELAYGAKFICRYSLEGSSSEDGDYLRNLFNSITEDVFFDAAMSLEFESKVQQARAEGKLVWPDFECEVKGGKSVTIPALPTPFELGQLFQTWQPETSSMVMQRVAVQPISVLPEVELVLLNMSSAEALPISSLQRFTSDTTQSLSYDLALAAFAKNSALWATSYDCAKTNTSLLAALADLQDTVTSYAARAESLSGSAWSDMQLQFSQGNYSWLEGQDLIGRYNSLMKYCDAQTTASLNNNANGTTVTTTTSFFLHV